MRLSAVLALSKTFDTRAIKALTTSLNGSPVNVLDIDAVGLRTATLLDIDASGYTLLNINSNQLDVTATGLSAARPDLAIVARAESDAGAEHLRNLGANDTVMGEREIAHAMFARAAARAD